MRYISSPEFRQDGERIGVLLVNTGTPDSLEVADVRRYLDKFLSDPRVIEFPRWLWLGSWWLGIGRRSSLSARRVGWSRGWCRRRAFGWS